MSLPGTFTAPKPYVPSIPSIPKGGGTSGPGHWMFHDIRPRDPYIGPNANKSRGNTLPPRADGKMERVDKTVTMNTGGETKDNTLHPTTNGEPSYAYRRKGYFSCPDWTQPRPGAPGARGYDPAHFNKKHMLEAERAVKEAPRAMPGDIASYNHDGLRSSQYKGLPVPTHISESGELVGKVYFRSKDEVWTDKKGWEADHAIEKEKKAEMRQVMIRERELKDEKLKKDLKESRELDLKNRDVNYWGGPYSGCPKPVMKKFGLKRNPPFEGYPTPSVEKVHTTLKDVPGWEIGKDTNTNKDVSDRTVGHRVRHDINKHDNTESRYEPRVETKMKNWEDAKSYHADLMTQAKARQNKRRLEREMSSTERNNDKGIAASFGAPGGGAPSYDQNGNVVTKLSNTLSKPFSLPPDFELAKYLEVQAAEKKVSREHEAHEARYQKFESYDPFAAPGATRLKKGARKQYANQFGMKEMEDTIKTIPGTSLLNEMGKPGGGAPVGLVTVPNQDDEQFRIELKAQEDGKSEWGKPGGGAPIKNEDGTIKKSTRGAAEGDKSGYNFYKKSPEKFKQVKKIQKDQQRFLEQMEATKKQRKVDSAKENAQVAQGIEKQIGMLSDTLPPPEHGKTKRHFQEPGSTAHRYDPVVLEDQIQEKARAQAEVHKATVEADLLHNEVANNWVGKGSGQPQFIENNSKAARRVEDRLLHPEHAKKTNPVDIKKYHDELETAVIQKVQKRKANKIRMVKEARIHGKVQNKFEGTPGGGAPNIDQKTGVAKTRLRAPKGSAGEYRLLVPPAKLLE